jgi:hypothetical protein
MLTGRHAFQGDSTVATIAAVTRDAPTAIKQLVQGVPPEVERVVLRCLRKAPEERFASGAELEKQLEACCTAASQLSSGMNLKALVRRPVIAVPTLVTMLAMASLSVWWFQRSSRIRWAKDEALPQIAHYIELEQWDNAYSLAAEAERYIRNDPGLGKFWPAISWQCSIRTIPAGASVFRRKYNAPDEPWVFVGHSPVENQRMPRVNSQWKFELKGFATVERATFPSGPLRVQMDELGKASLGMVHLRGDAESRPDFALLGLPGFEDLPGVPLGDYWIDRYEVTNAQFKQFLDHDGYLKPEFWKHEFRRDGHSVPWTEVMTLFHDRTGGRGPATWEQGEFPGGQEDYPVTGVSWYEAAAYAEFASKTLPTIYQWTAAAFPQNGAAIVPASNFLRQGPAPIGRYHGMSRSGAYDMAGNVKEWCWNEAGSGKRYILGGAWDEPTYMFNSTDARSPFDRSANFGFRCAKVVSTGGADHGSAPVTAQAREFSRERPVSDELFRAYKSLYSYDKTPLHAVVEATQQTAGWKQEKITFGAAYGNEQVIPYLFLPAKAHPPFQTVVYFPGGGAIHLRSSAGVPELGAFDFVIKSGRAVMFPIYKGTYERGGDLKMGFPNATSSYRDHVIAWSKDLRRSIDYLETRPEIDISKLAYEGISWGAAAGAVQPAVEDRIKACVLILPGFYLQKCLPEVDQLNFAPHVKVPVLMLNGRFDSIFPVDTAQIPMFRMLGTPKEQKRRVVYDTGHNIPRNEMIKETLDWLDRYLGPVT